VGIDDQFFATLLYNASDADTTKFIEQYIPQAVHIDKDDSQKSDVSVLFTSKPIELGPGEISEPQEYTLYSGPKRESLLNQMDAGEIMDFGWFAVIAKGMLWILSVLHNTLMLPYGLAIIGLTIMVRAALFPLSKKQAVSAARMKELQPRLQELKKRYGSDKQKFAQAQMELFRDAGYNPFAGCLPMLFQLPIFIGLYSALSHAVDLRAAQFLWVKNLAAPDQLFQWPGGFRLPFLGHYFNLLPLVTVGLFLVQQKMFMPAPDPDDEQAQMQHKVMNFMMIFMGFLFYHVPAGLCVYFIASSLWGMGERKLLDYGKAKTEDASGGGDASTKASNSAGSFKTTTQNGRDKDRNAASKKRGKQSKSRR
jgi:YidC/Oxa1 family membrane protein insertase